MRKLDNFIVLGKLCWRATYLQADDALYAKSD